MLINNADIEIMDGGGGDVEITHACSNADYISTCNFFMPAEEAVKFAARLINEAISVRTRQAKKGSK